MTVTHGEYSEAPEAGNKFRARMLDEVKVVLRREQGKADRRRRAFFQPDFSSLVNYVASMAGYRQQLREMLGWPLTEQIRSKVPAVSTQSVAEDSLGKITRIWIETLPGLHTYGLFFRPHGRGKFPLVISQHGGGGTPELCSNFFGSANYNNMTRRVLARGVAVFAPQLLLWNVDQFGPKHEKDVIDRRLKQIGGSLAALDLLRITTGLDYLVTRRDIDARRIGMIGLSYGGFFTLFAAALDERIKVAVSSCFFNDRKIYDFPDWSWFGAANRFLDAEVGALVCPRPLYIEVGKKDAMFDVRRARPEAKRLAAVYRKLRIAERFRYKEHKGVHELDKADDGIDFLCRHLNVE